MKYVLKNKRFEYQAGTKVYDFCDHDYGLSRDDSLIFGMPHVSVTVNPDGDAPFFTVPIKDLELIEA